MAPIPVGTWLGERGFDLLTGRWRALQRITVSPSRVGDLVKAALVLSLRRPGPERFCATALITAHCES